MFGNRALYHDGWIAVCRHGRLPWMNQGSLDFADDNWELYNIDDDFSEANDLAAKNPEKLQRAAGHVLGGGRRSTTCCRSTTVSPSAPIRACGRA